MKKFTFLYFFLLFTLAAVAQKQANIWYFGTRVGLDFNQTPPTPLYNSAINGVEGTAVISDQDGKLVCYTDGLNLINKGHTPMKNGNLLLGDVSSTDNVIFVPQPGNDSIYFLFTIGAAYKTGQGFRYNVINMRRDGGFGEVMNKNVLIEPEAYEKVAAIRHCNNKDVWVLIHKWNSDEYDAYLVTAAGVSTTPVISHTGLVITGIQSNAIGTLKFSADGQHVAAVHAYDNNLIELSDFNKLTGFISNPVRFSPDPLGAPQTFTGVYSASFSPSGNLLYVSDNIISDEPSSLYQYDISSHNAATITASKQVIAHPSPWFSGVLQTGPDKKMYMAMLGDTALTVIENPDVYGLGCNYNYNKIFLARDNGVPVQFGLPNFIQSFFDPGSNPYDFSRSGNCSSLDVPFTLTRTNAIDSVKWNFGDGQGSQAMAPIHHFNIAGSYDVQLIVYKIDCSGLNDTITHTIWVAGQSGFLGADTGTCGLISFQVGIDPIASASYLWNTGASTNAITIDTFGLYWLRVEQHGCSVTDSINVYKKPAPVANIQGDTLVCPGQAVILHAGTATANSDLWNTGAVSPSIIVTTPGSYKIVVTGNACDAADSVMVTWGDCEAFVPTAFTPNQDGLNDKFGVAAGFIARNFSLRVYDRYGHIIFEAEDNATKWDGTYKGKAMPGGGYTWIMSYINTRGFKRAMQGSVLLIR